MMSNNNEHGSANGQIASDRSNFTPRDTVRYIWDGLELPGNALESLELEESDPYYQSSFKISHIAQSAIALSALGAALIQSVRSGSHIPKVTLPLRPACLEYLTERLYSIDGKPTPSTWGPIGGLHATADGYVRIHDSFPNHRNGTLALLELDEKATRESVARQVKKWRKLELEEAGYKSKLAVYALRSYDEWRTVPQSRAISDFPILIKKISDDGPKGLPRNMKADGDRCLRGLRVVELSRVLAAPVAGKTLASHGADVLWVTAPNLPDLPTLDRITSQGKRTIQFDLNKSEDQERMRELIKDGDVFIQGYRPGSLAAKGFSTEDLVKLKPGLMCANLSAFGPTGPWSDRRGFDSLVQTCSGMNVSEAEHYGDGSPARPMPCQALDHTAGYFLATGIAAALYKRAMEGGSWEVHVSLAGVMKYLTSLGQWPGSEGFEYPDPGSRMEDVPDEYFEEKESGFGCMRYLKHAADIEGSTPGFDHMPKPLGSDEPRWL